MFNTDCIQSNWAAAAATAAAAGFVVASTATTAAVSVAADNDNDYDDYGICGVGGDFVWQWSWCRWHQCHCC